MMQSIRTWLANQKRIRSSQKLNRSRQSARRRRWWGQFESLEQRSLMAVVGSLEGNVWVITSNDASDSITIIRNSNQTYTYNVGTGVRSVSQTAISEIRFFGNGGNDVFNAQSVLNTPVVANGGLGNDRLTGGNGNDTLIGGDGTDILNGLIGNNRIESGNGNDTVSIGLGNDTLLDTGGIDTLTAAGVPLTPLTIDLSQPTTTTSALTSLLSLTLNGGDWETLIGSNQNDILIGNSLNNRIVGNGGNDLIRGGGGNDTLLGGAGDDTLYGETGADTLDGELGTDRLFGGLGNDLYLLNPQAGAIDFFYENEAEVGVDVIKNVSSAPLVLNSFTSGNGIDRIDANFQPVQGTEGSDFLDFSKITFTNLTEVIDAKGGNDVIRASRSANVGYQGGAGDDRLFGGSLSDVFYTSPGKDTLQGGGGNDTYVITSDEAVAATMDDEILDGSGTGDVMLLPSEGFVSVLNSFETSNGIDIISRKNDESLPLGLEIRILINDKSLIDFSKVTFDLDEQYSRVRILANNVSTIIGSEGPETIELHGNTKRILGLGGNDSIAAFIESGSLTTSDLTIDGNAGDDSIYISDARSNSTISATLRGGDGDDYFSSSRNSSSYYDGGAGDDTYENVALASRIFDESGTADRLLVSNGVQIMATALEPFTPASGIDIIQSDFYNAAGSFFDLQANGLGAIVDLTGVALSAGTPESRNFVIVSGTSGNDQIYAASSSRSPVFYLGGDGDDQIWGGPDDDELVGGLGNDILWGNGGNDSLRPGEGNNVAYGGNGDDTLLTDFGSEGDQLFGEEGDDSYNVGSLIAPRIMDSSGTQDAVFGLPVNYQEGGNNYSRLELTFDNFGSFTGVDIVHADTINITRSFPGTVDLSGIEFIPSYPESSGVYINCTMFDSTFIGSDSNEIIFAGRGNVTLTGGLGADIFKTLGTTPNSPSSHYRIMDFTQGTDRLWCDDVTSSEVIDGNLFITTDGVTIELVGFTGTLTESDFYHPTLP